MNTRSKFLLLALLVACAGSASAADAQGPRQRWNFNLDWKLHVGDEPAAREPEFDDSRWPQVSLPRAWNEDEAFAKAIDEISTGIAWYRKHFRLPAGAPGRKVFVEFEGVRQAAEFYLNGELLGRHENGVMAVGFDISDRVLPTPRENVLAVRVDNDWNYRELASGRRFQWSDRNFNANYGGIPKNVRLHVAGPVYQSLPLYSHLGTTGVYVYARDFDVAGRAATISAESEVINETREDSVFTYEVTIADPTGRTVARFPGGTFTAPERGRVIARASARLTGLELWSWGYGYLYDVTTTLRARGQVLDSVTTRTGFRKTEFAQGVFKLNDRVLHIKGYAQRTSNEWPAVGISVSPSISDYSNRLMVTGGANTVRWMHVTPWKQDVESLDRVGLMMLMPAGDSERDAQGVSWAMRVALMRDAIVYNRNNPSVVFYESGNKGIDERHMLEMVRLRDFYDPHGGRAMGSREMLDSKVAEWGGEMLYIDKSAGKPLFATEYSRDEGLRKYWDEFSPPFHKDGDGPPYRNAPAAAYNRNQDSHAIEDVERWYDYWRERPGTGRRVSAGGLNIIFSDTNTHFRGAENYRRSGEVDAMRIPKDGFHAHRVMWDGWVDPGTPGIHILGHWNYAPGVRKPVYVVSSADRVELFRNGRSLGFGTQSARFLFTFPAVDWEPGEIRAVGHAADGTRLVETRHRTAGAPAALRLRPIVGGAGIRADGADMALLEIEVVDGRGNRCPTALDLVTFDVSGPADWRGGIAQGPGNYILAKTLPVEGGVNRVLIRSTRQAGTVVVNASARGLRSASTRLVMTPVANSDGLAEVMPDSGTVANLDRGPTPATAAFETTRRPMEVVGVTAGSNAATAGASIDDDETSAWSSTGSVAEAWIEYQLARPARIAEVTLKLTGWRDRTYPIAIAVDGREVFRGTTPRSFGYVTLPLAATSGGRVRISLASTGDGASPVQATEVENQKNVDTGADRVGVTNLSIVEAELYE